MRRTDGALLRALGVWGLAASIVNVTVGGGIFGLPARVAASLGAAAPIAYLVCAGAMALIVMSIAEAGSRVSLTGGPYAYIETAFGPLVGFLAGVLLWLLGTTAVAAVATLFGASAARLAPGLGLATPLGRALLLVAVFALCAAVNVRGVRQGSRLNAIAAVAKLAPLLILIVVGAFAVRPENLRWGATPAVGDIARASVLLVFAFSGVESALVPSGEVRDPARTVPRAVLAAMLAVTLLYIALQLVAQGILGADMARYPDTPLAEAAGRALGPAGRTLLLVGTTVSMFGYVSGMTLAVPRALYAFARDGFLPRSLARVHERFRTPHVAIVIQTIIVCGVALSGTFERLAIVSNVAVLVLYGGCAAASWELRRRDVRGEGMGVPFRLPLGGLVSFAAIGAILFILSSLPVVEIAVVSVVLAVAVVIFAASRGRRAVAEMPESLPR
ncbi:MAG: amino acid permease [Gemmatimonadaceae bacterium]